MVLAAKDPRQEERDARAKQRQIDKLQRGADRARDREARGRRAEFERITLLDYERRPELRPIRVALTEEQVREHGLPTAPPKRSDTRSRSWVGQTCQLEAMPPELLASTVRAAIREQLDVPLFEREVAREEADRERIERGLELAEEAE